ncbi:P-loop NTPase fold protein [Candidatus Pantoea rara]|uniref:P-loop NTPase fold protein n=1 Tax=Candidatus Pantoea rara TaxID=1947037 RepID=UPI003EBF96C4
MNEHVRNYLKYYIEMNQKPKFAVVINGEWGSGKTWLVDDILKPYDKKEYAIIKVSLYGLTNTGQIDTEIYKKVHPVLSGKGMLIAGALSKALLKGTLKIDFNSDQKDDASMSLGIPEINFEKLSKKPEDTILIFDDFERCEISWEQFFGYVNHFTEESGCKAIIITNEESEKIKKDISSYLTSKEKVVGQTLKVKADTNSALLSFAGNHSTPLFKGFMQSKGSILLSTIDIAKSNNLRLLRKFILDFEKLYNAIPSDIRKNDTIMERLLATYFIFYFEKTSNHINLFDVENISDNLIKRNDGAFKALYEKYSFNTFGDLILSDPTWNEIINNGNVVGKTIEEEINFRLTSMSSQEANWVKLWEFTVLKDDEFARLYKQVFSELESLSFTNINIVKHIVGMMEHFNKIALIDADMNKVLALSKKCIDKMVESGGVEYEDHAHPQYRYNESWGGLGFFERDSLAFKDICNYVKLVQQKALEAELVNASKKLVEFIRNDDKDYFLLLNYNDRGIKSYHDKPMLAFIDCDELTKAFLACRSKSTISYAFKERYAYQHSSKELISEIPVFSSFVKNIKKIADEKSMPLLSYNIKDSLERYLEPSLSQLKQLADIPT